MSRSSTLRHEGIECLHRHRPGEVVALAEIASGRRQQVALALGLHALGNHLQAQFR